LTSKRNFILLCAVPLLLLSACVSAADQKSTLQAKTAGATSAPTLTVTPGPTATPVCTAIVGTTQQIKIDSKAMGETLTFTIYLPPCYNAKKTGGYPIIYLFHGQSQNDTYWPSLGITQAADREIQGGSPAFIMVFPYEVHNWDPPAGSKFGEAFMEDLVPYVESHYAVCLVRSCQAIGGLSRGAGWAMHIGLTNFDKFGAIGAHSIGYFPGDAYRIDALLKSHSAADFPRIYMDRGEDDYLKLSIDQFEQHLTAAGVAHEFHISPGKHETAYWQSQVQNYLDWYIEGFTNQ
jgi:enterochelin esterase-like enzyme